jgi:opacity protein-like surface antigen
VRFKFALPLIFLVISVPVFSQVTPAATQGGIPISIGAGFSNFNMDWGYTRMDGGTLWVDWNPTQLPSYLRGLGLELEARDISLNRGDKPSNFRTDTLGGGPTYSWRHFRNFHPYVKGIASDGNIDFRLRSTTLTHINWNVYAIGGGLNYRVFKSIWVRGDYEYQGWFDIFNNNKVLDPQGFTIGAVYDFGRPHYH